MSKGKAVLISDVHYNLQTLALADNAMRQAVAKANELNLPLIVAGDLHDTKANLRAECVNALIQTFNLLQTRGYVLVGNHDLTNERASTNALEFLDGLNGQITLIRQRADLDYLGVYCAAYHSNPDDLRAYLKTLPKGSTVIMHQGIQGSNSGEYIQDHSAITKDDVKNLRVISGHYHQRQDIKTGRPQKGHAGLFSYIGNPYSLTFGEAGDPEKGFRILNEDGSLDFVPTNLRKHVIFEVTAKDLSGTVFVTNPEDLVWVKVRDTKEALAKLSKLPSGVRIDLIPTDVQERFNPKVENMSQNELLDSLIDASGNLSDTKKIDIKNLWKGL